MQKKRLQRILVTLVLIGIVAAAAAVLTPQAQGTELQLSPRPFTSASQQASSAQASLKLHVLDVGQGDCLLLQSGGEAMLVDAGHNADAEKILAYLDAQGVTELALAVGTHPHEDHIGSLDAVLDHLRVRRIWMPKAAHTTKTFEDVLDAVARSNLQVESPAPGDTFALGSATVRVLCPAPGETFDDLNDYSIVLEVTCGQTRFLLTGDAGKRSENAMLEAGVLRPVDVLKVGHHGSNGSSSEAFLSAVSPAYAVMTTEPGSSTHPGKKAYKRLQAAGAALYESAISGDIVFTSDGARITVSTEK